MNRTTGDIGPVLKTYFIEKDQDRALLGYIPIMAATCKGSIGALLLVSFCERIQVNSCANQIVTAGNTSLGDDLVDKTVVLRMNKNFMKFMNLNYPGPGFSNKDFQHSVLSSPSLTTSKMISRWTRNRYIHVSMYS